MKILAICQHYAPEPFIVSLLMEQMVSFGHEVYVVTGYPNYGYGKIMDGYNGKIHSDELIHGVHVHRVPIYPRKDSKISICKNYLSYWRNAKKYVRTLDGSFDVVFSMTLSPVISAAAGNLYAKKYHKPHLHYCVDLWPESLVVTGTIQKNGPLYPFFYHWSKSIYKRANRILFSSPSFETYFKKVLHLENKSYGLLYQPSLHENQSIENPIQYEEGTVNFVYCGNFGKLQCLSYIYEGLERMKDHPEIRFHMIGMGKEKKKFLIEVKKRGLENQIIDHGALPSSIASSYFASADALYLALKKDGYVGHTIPNKLNFYLSFGKPIVAMIDYDAKDILLSSQGKGIIKEETTEAFIETIKEFLLLSKEEKEEMGRKNRIYFEEYFSLSKLSRKLEGELCNLKKASNS